MTRESSPSLHPQQDENESERERETRREEKGEKESGEKRKEDILLERDQGRRIETETETLFVMAQNDRLAVDYGEDEGGDVDMSETVSVSSSLFEYVEENGRTYHKYKEGKYLLPNDEKERNRLDMQHHLCKLSLHGRLGLAPLKEENLKHALDIGTGTGIWAIEFAEQHPTCQVIGSDLSPIQPEFVPENCAFEVDDIEDEWLYPHPFNYIHSRLMVFCLRSPLTTIRKAYAALAPGGWLEMQDTCSPLMSIDDTIVDTALLSFYDKVTTAATRIGIDVGAAKRYKEMMEQVGFVDVKEVRVEWPIGGWAKSTYHKMLGKWFRADLETGMEAIALGMFTRILGMRRDEVEELIVRVKRDMDLKEVHAYQPFYVVFGRKPEVLS